MHYFHRFSTVTPVSGDILPPPEATVRGLSPKIFRAAPTIATRESVNNIPINTLRGGGKKLSDGWADQCNTT